MSKGSCTFCGEHFDNVFEAIDHVEPGFDPYLIMPDGFKFKTGSLLWKIYENAGNNERIKNIVEREISFLYIAEKRPDQLAPIFYMHVQSGAEPMSIVYDIVGEDSWKKLATDTVQQIKDPEVKRYESTYDLIRQVQLGLLSFKTFNQKVSIMFGGSGK